MATLVSRNVLPLVLPLALLAQPAAPQWISEELPPMTDQEHRALELVDQWQQGSQSDPILGAGGQVLFVYGIHVPRVVCAPLNVCDIALQAGEQLTSDPHLGDSARWLLGMAESGAEERRITHLLVKPLDAGLSTNLVVATNRRTYHLDLLSHPKKSMPSVGFLYPERLTHRRTVARQTSVRQSQERKMPGLQVSLEQLDFNYEIEGEASWRPARVFNDGRQTYIELPIDLEGEPGPVLYVLDADGEMDLVNYRVLGNRYVVDAVFQRAALILGVGDEQRQVTIRRGAKLP